MHHAPPGRTGRGRTAKTTAVSAAPAPVIRIPDCPYKGRDPIERNVGSDQAASRVQQRASLSTTSMLAPYTHLSSELM